VPEARAHGDDECAQPCRLPVSVRAKDRALAALGLHIAHSNRTQPERKSLPPIGTTMILSANLEREGPAVSQEAIVVCQTTRPGACR